MTLYGEDSRNRKSVLQPFRCLKTFMGKLTMVRCGDCSNSHDVSPETQPSSPWSIAKRCSESHHMSDANNGSNNLVLLIHLLPAFVCPWEYLEVPEFGASKIGQFQSFPLLSLICLPHDVDDSLLGPSLFLSLFRHGIFLFLINSVFAGDTLDSAHCGLH